MTRRSRGPEKFLNPGMVKRACPRSPAGSHACSWRLGRLRVRSSGTVKVVTTEPVGHAALSEWVAVGALAAGVIGGGVGLVVGLLANPATAWFAVFEIGVPREFSVHSLGSCSEC